MSKRFRESGENNTILACLLESLTEFVRSVRARAQYQSHRILATIHNAHTRTSQQVRDCKAVKSIRRKSALRTWCSSAEVRTRVSILSLVHSTRKSPNSNTGTKKSGNVKQRLERRYNKTWCEHVRTRFPKFQCCNVFSIHEIVVASEYYLNQLSKLQEGRRRSTI